jgi:hypothetical protein
MKGKRQVWRGGGDDWDRPGGFHNLGTAVVRAALRLYLDSRKDKMKTALRLTVAAAATAITCSVGLEAQTLSISPTGLLNWSDNGTQHVVVSAKSLPGLWTPLGQTISNLQGQSSMLIPCVEPSQFFKLSPGWQFRDEFDGSHEPLRPFFFDPSDSAKHTFTYTNGTLRIQGASNTIDGMFYLQPQAFARTNFADFHISVDVVDWQDHGTPQLIGLLARLTAAGDDAYIGELIWHFKLTGNTVLNIFDGSDPNWVEVALKPDKGYRLVFVGVKNRLACSLYELGEVPTLVNSVSITNNYFRSGRVGLFCSRANLTNGLYDVTVDNFAMTGTKP